MVLANRRFTTLDYDKLRRDVQASVDRLRAENVATREQMEAMASFVSRHCIGLAGEGYHVHRRLDAPDAAPPA